MTYTDSYSYLNSVDLGIGNPTPAQLDKITQLQNALFAAQEKFWSVSDSAYAAYTADPQAQATKKTFAAWVVQKDPVYTAYKNAMRTANSALQTYTLQVYGPAYNTLTDQRAAIETLAQDGTELQPGCVFPISSLNTTLIIVFNRYNMPDYGGTYNVQFTPFAPHTITDGLCYKPLYTLTGGFSETCDSWINGTGGTFSYTWSLKTSNFQDWSSLGHSTSVSQVGGSLFSILSATHSGTNVETQFNEWTSTSVNSISLQLTMNGAPTVFSIATGEWDVPSVRRTYPHLTSNGINQLSGHIRLTKLLLGHEVGCKITVADSATWKSVSQFIQDAKSDTGGGISIFGFYFGGSGSSVTHRNITDIQTSNQNTGGVIVIPPSRLGIPMLLGAFGKAV